MKRGQWKALVGVLAALVSSCGTQVASSSDETLAEQRMNMRTPHGVEVIPNRWIVVLKPQKATGVLSLSSLVSSQAHSLAATSNGRVSREFSSALQGFVMDVDDRRRRPPGGWTASINPTSRSTPSTTTKPPAPG
jgi:hypothetical protein